MHRADSSPAPHPGLQFSRGSHCHTSHHIQHVFSPVHVMPFWPSLGTDASSLTLMRTVDPCTSWKMWVGLWFEREGLSFPKNHQVRCDMEENWPLDAQEQKAKRPRSHRAALELSVEGRPGLWLCCPRDSPQRLCPPSWAPGCTITLRISTSPQNFPACGCYWLK